MTIPGPDLRVAGVTQPAFRVLALAGLGAGVIVAMLSPTVDRRLVAATSAVAFGTCLVVLVARVATTRRGHLVWSEHEATTLVVTLVIGVLAGELGRLADAMALGLVTMLAVGRVGCLMAGCCHGRPAPHGIRYGPAHTAYGFPPRLVGISLVPVQALESAWAVVLVAGGLMTVIVGPPGLAAAVVLAGRAAGRFALEFVRGDDGRGNGALTRPQWWALATLGAVAVAVAVTMAAHLA